MRSVYVLLLTAALATLALFHDRLWSALEVFDSDQGGYYVYLPSAFIYQDLGRADSLARIQQRYKPGHEAGLDFVALPNGKVISKYSLGVALADLPWFGGAHLYAGLTRQPQDGFSRPYQQIIMVAGLFHGLLGLWLLRRLLRHYFDDCLTAWVLAGVGLGTNLLCYISFDAGMAHAPLFLWQTALLYCTLRWYEVRHWSFAAGIGLFLGLAVLTRPTEVLYLLIPLTWGLTTWPAWQQRPALWRQHGGQLALAVAFFLGLVSLQLLFWRVVSGQWLLYTYQQEGFDFAHPQIVAGLFSFRKGWLLYTPLAAVMLLGVVVVRRYLAVAFVPVLLTVPVVVYVTFSWWQWWYGGGFSARPLISLYPLLALPLAALLALAQQRSAAWFRGLTTLITLCIVLNLWQTRQYGAGILPWDNNTAAEYSRRFWMYQSSQLALPNPAAPTAP